MVDIVRKFMRKLKESPPTHIESVIERISLTKCNLCGHKGMVELAQAKKKNEINKLVCKKCGSSDWSMLTSPVQGG